MEFPHTTGSGNDRIGCSTGLDDDLILRAVRVIWVHNAWLVIVGNVVPQTYKKYRGGGPYRDRPTAETAICFRHRTIGTDTPNEAHRSQPTVRLRHCNLRGEVEWSAGLKVDAKRMVSTHRINHRRTLRCQCFVIDLTSLQRTRCQQRNVMKQDRESAGQLAAVHQDNLG